MPTPWRPNLIIGTALMLCAISCRMKCRWNSGRLCDHCVIYRNYIRLSNISWCISQEIVWNFNRNSNISIPKNAFVSVVCEKVAILFWPQCVKIFMNPWCTKLEVTRQSAVERIALVTNMGMFRALSEPYAAWYQMCRFLSMQTQSQQLPTPVYVTRQYICMASSLLAIT